MTHDDFMPKNYQEKSAIFLQVARLLFDLEKKMPIDLIVHTKKMHERFLELNSLFCKTIQKDGVMLYEHVDAGVVTSRSR